MKLTLFLSVLTLFSVAAGDLNSQEYQVKLNLENASIIDVFKEIESQTDLGFAFRDNQLDLEKSYNFNEENVTVKEILNDVFEDQDCEYKILADYIVVLKKNESASTNIRQEGNSVTGTVTDSQGDPIPGVSIMIKGTTKGTITDLNGSYSLSGLTQGDVIIYSFVGMTDREIEYSNQRIMDISLKEELTLLDEVVVIGYGTVSRRDLTGSVSKITVAEFQNRPATNPAELMLGTIAGLNYDLSASAKPGGALEIRGPTSLNASNEPLIVLDGVIYNGDLTDINPNDIEAIDVLKDGSSAAVYGSRASNGVIIVTTKVGKSDKPVIQFDVKVGLANLIQHQRPFDKDEYLEVRKGAKMNVFPDAPPYYYYNPNDLPSDIDLQTWLDYDPGGATDPEMVWLQRLQLENIEQENYYAGKTIDWYDEVFQTGLRQDYNLSISGTTNNLNYYWSLGSANNEGIVYNESYKNIRSRLNLSADVTSYLKVGMNSHLSLDDDGDEPANWQNAIKVSPYGSKYEPDGSLKWYPHDDNQAVNPFEPTLYDIEEKSQALMATLFAKLSLPFGFKYELNFSNRFRWNNYYQYRPISTRSGNSSNGYAERDDSRLYNWQIDNILRWDKTFANIHRFDLTFLYNAEQLKSYRTISESSNFTISEALGFNGIQLGALPIVSSNDQYETGMAMMARLNYSLLERYLFTISYRRDGYSAFGQQNPTADFPAAAFAWRLSDEPFMNNVRGLDNLKVRLSWGVNGNRSIGRYSALSRLNDVSYIINGQSVKGLYPTNLPNENLKWERTTAYNVGLDFGILNNRLTGNLDAYLMSTQDLLLTRALPDITGYTDVISNLGEIENRGFEATLSSINMLKSNFNWKSRLIFSLNRNQIKHLYGEMVDVLDSEGNVIGQREDDDIQNGWYIGHALDEIYEYKVIGVWQEGEEAEAINYARFPGDFKLLDVNGDGFFLPDSDNVWLGYKEPRYRLSFSNTFELFNCIDVSFLLRGYFGHLGDHNYLTHQQTDRRNNYKMPYWTPENPSNEYARLMTVTHPTGFNIWRSRSFLRVQDITLAYRVPKKLTDRLRITRARVYLNLNNLYNFQSWEYWDAETYDPTPLITTLGLSVAL